VKYRWSLVEVHANGDTVRELHERFVSAADLDTSSRWHEVYQKDEPLEHPGYTAYTIGAALYDKLRGTGSGAFSMLAADDNGGGRGFGEARGPGGLPPVIVRWRGTLTRVGPSAEPFPLLFNGRRITVPALHVKAELTSRDEHWAPELWILAQRDQPLI